MFRPYAPDALSEHAEQLAEAGYTIIPGLLEDEGCRRIKSELDRLHADQPFGDNDFAGTRTKRVFNLFAKTRVLDSLLVQPDVLTIVRSALGPEAQLSIASTMEIHGGETFQALHRDDAYFPDAAHPPLVINTIWALTDFSLANGATRLVPGSHLCSEPVDPAAAWIAAEMPRGSVLLWNGAVWHGGGANTTGEARFGLSLNYCRGWLRQQENQYLGLDPATVASLPEEVQKLLGYDICQFVGWVDGRHPMRAILPEVRARIHAGIAGRRDPM
ncbi:phytanoyl-CoA dioxygenase family protein [Sphingopyxis sp. 113P3]|uniref:phytanoyl-CoA dioxygenase family protein n=1 Tax=Sphingopyxis sp. (strain 113P3) TaxID=292913 RepID=UPI0006AD1405|nr:phytanoyl-CoA dioxygenase family protein [Sphingopyxis sp. 113P3]